jgi:hypothetical protein
MTGAPQLTASVLSAAETRPAGGAALGEVLLATALGLVLTAVLLGLVWLHRSRRWSGLTTAGNLLGRATRVPAWVALPTILATVCLLVALFGMMWDISLHIDVGRDPGPLANPAHYFILFGLFGVFSAGVLACAMPLGEKPGPVAVHFLRGWDVPVGGVLLTASGFYALLGFPLDDIWHRIFGQDVTLWGPTHLMLIGGAGLSLVGILLLEQEGHGGASTDDGARKVGGAGRYLRQAAALGGLLLGLSVFQGEFDFDVAQFRQVLDPLMIAGAAGVALVAARLWMGRGGALLATVFFLVVRGVISLLVGPILGETTPTFPLYLGSAIVVELLALVVPLIRRPLLYAVVAGLGIGTLGHLSEIGWSNLTRTLHWGSDIAVEGTLMAVLAGVAGALLGALLALGMRRRLPRPAFARAVLVASLLTIAALVTNGLIATVPGDLEATISIDEASSSPRTGVLTVQLDPDDFVDDPAWVQVTSWQGGGLVVDPLEKVGPGRYRTDEAVPLDDDWKTMLRIHDGRVLTAVAIYLPADPVIGADEIAADDGVTRQAVPEKTLLQREQKAGTPHWLWNVSSILVLICTIAILAAISWGVGRYSRRGSASEPFPDEPADAPTPTGAGSR